MNTQSGGSWQVVFASRDKEDPLFNEFMETFFTASACNFTENGKLCYVGYTSKPVDEQEMSHTAAALGVALPSWKCDYIPATNWLTRNVIAFPPLITNDFYIYGIHEEQTPQTDKHKLRIYAATAFGSGQHQTTRLCLEFLSRLFHRSFCPYKILDMGCGSGILALSSLLLWPNASAIAADIDNEAVIVTLQNAADNGLNSRINAACGNGYQNNLVRENAPYDLVFSNILARPLIEMSSALTAALKPGGYAVLSGFTEEQTDWVLEAHEKAGLKRIAVLKNENWCAALMEK